MGRTKAGPSAIFERANQVGSSRASLFLSFQWNE